jgi:hypothetical protein
MAENILRYGILVALVISAAASVVLSATSSLL